MDDALTALLSDTLYFFCMACSLICMVLLLRAYVRTRFRLLLWSGLCFVILSLNNAVLFVDVVFLPDMSLYGYRIALSLAAGVILLGGFIWEAQ